MRALVKREHGGSLRIEHRDDPVPDAGEVLVAIRAVGICGTDLHILDDVYPHAEPLIPGHEFAGQVVGAHEDSGSWKPGERVVGELHVGACLTCETCRSGNPQICSAKRALGTWSDGAFAELLAIPAWLLHRIPDGVSDEAATLIEPAACAWHALLERSRVDAGETVMVVGHGPIGLLSAHVAAGAGAGMVILVGRSGRGTARLDCARALGFAVIDAASEDVQARVVDLTAGRGVDLAVEAAGTEASLETCARCCRRGGRIVVLGVSERATTPFPWGIALQHDLTVSFSFSSRASSWKGVLDSVRARELPAEALITHVFEIDDWEAGFAAARSGEAVKVVLAL